ncbi:ubiquinol-cytochrome C chaperone family protein [Sphingomonas ginkgonis]|nr:ubiquinol-cytochrome C chaperone family protein [Sphingomonas ginkgonis]
MRLFKSEPNVARPLYNAVVERAREPDWYRDLGVPDTIDGRFAMLATIQALTTLRLEQGEDEARRSSVALTECFIENMDVEMRQLGISDPGISKKVGKLVGSLGNRVGEWRRVAAGEASWTAATHRSVYREVEVEGSVAALMEQRLRAFWAALQRTSDEALVAGQLP